VPKVEKKEETKAQRRSAKLAEAMVRTEKADLELHRMKQIKDYAEYKMMKGHSKETAYQMAKAHILNSNDKA
jgi:hypothetical protein|tara:strand:- start:11423 stop:11638 length:216 start_codon:yes stop_codon:yes gene_type:complete